jgi:hypothetical protein
MRPIVFGLGIAAALATFVVYEHVMSNKSAPTPPTTAQNPPPPTGWRYMPQAHVTQPLALWAKAIHDDDSKQPFDTVLSDDGAVLARVEWHPADASKPYVHRGVSLFEPA